ncbi:P22 phage major capsid protein family protein [Streptomyces sp. CA-181903]|uniref:P22 phage major capsid protein family protein n=1 Tax=Streptomyces sp. CA-181903 TaxID=3240055 RepID=UPI003D8BFEA9
MTDGGNKIAVTDKIAAVALAGLRAEIILPVLVYRDVERDFVAGVGHTVNVRKPSKFTASNKARGVDLVPENLDEKVVPVKIDTHATHGVNVDTQDSTLNIESYMAQVTIPQAQAIADSVEERVARELNTVINADGKTTLDAEGKVIPAAVEHKAKTSFRDTLVKVDEIMNGRDIPLEGRYLVVNPKLRAELLMTDLFVKASESGDPNVVRSARRSDADARVVQNFMGKFLGFSVFLSNKIEGAVAFTREAFALAVSAPNPSSAAGSSARWSEKGYAMRLATDWSGKSLAELHTADTLAGACILDGQRAVGIKLTA